MADKNPPPQDELDNLRRRVDAARGEASSANPPQGSAASLAMRFGGEFGAAILVGALLGFGADHFLHSSPWGLMIGLGLGFATGITNVVRTAAKYNQAHPSGPSARPVADDDDD